MANDRPRFRRSAYWGKWCLVLTTRHRRAGSTRPGSARTVEIDLEPVNGWARCTAEQRERTVGLNMRVHCTPMDPADRMAHDLPADVRSALDAHLGEDLAAWLLDPATEILGLVNWPKHDKLSNGGASLRDSAWGHLAHLVPEARPMAAVPDRLAA